MESNLPLKLRTAVIFDIERYATKDGPGIRTVVFFKGCVMRCSWCANPASQISRPQISFVRRRCRKCGKCVDSCEKNAIRMNNEYGLVTDGTQCDLCGRCVRECYYNAREIVGKLVTVAQVMETVLRDSIFYEQSGGGVTASGGEPLLQIDFLLDLLRECKEILSIVVDWKTERFFGYAAASSTCSPFTNFIPASTSEMSL